MVLAYYEEIKNFMKIHAKNDPKSEHKIDVWAIRGPTFEVLGGFLRSLIFLLIFDWQKNRTFGVRWSAKRGKRDHRGSGRRVGRGPSEALESAEIGRSI